MKTRIRPQIESLEGRAMMAAGALDPTFAGTGMVTTQLGGTLAGTVAVQADGKIVAANSSTYVSTGGYVLNHMALVRYNVDGTLDATFGVGGEVVIPGWSSTSREYVNSIAIQGDGKIVAVGALVPTMFNKKGYNPYAPAGWEVVRINPGGSLDTSFGAGKGRVFTDPTPNDDIPNAVALQANGKIVVAGYIVSSTSTGEDIGVMRYNTDGSLDSTFGNAGIVETSPGNVNGADDAYALAIDPSGRILIAGFTGYDSTTGLPSRPDLLRYMPSGILDPSFGSGGLATIPSSFNFGAFYGVGLQSTGKIVVSVAGDMARYNSDGSLDDGSAADTTPGDHFGTQGIFRDPRILGSSRKTLVIQGDDKPVIAGQAYLNGARVNQFFAERVMADGTVADATFGSNGLAEADFGGTSARPYSIALAPDGKIVLAGGSSSQSSSGQFATARFLGDPSSTATTLVTSANPSAYGQSVTFTATVASGRASTPSGTVQFFDGSALLGSGSLGTVGGVTTATFATASLAAGTHSITASYGGDFNDLGSTSALLSQVVNASAPAAFVSRSNQPSSAASLPGPSLVPLILDEPNFLDSLARGKRRQA